MKLLYITANQPRSLCSCNARLPSSRKTNKHVTSRDKYSHFKLQALFVFEQVPQMPETALQKNYSEGRGEAALLYLSFSRRIIVEHRRTVGETLLRLRNLSHPTDRRYTTKIATKQYLTRKQSMIGQILRHFHTE
jgi:hypothetical protein